MIRSLCGWLLLGGTLLLAGCQTEGSAGGNPAPARAPTTLEQASTLYEQGDHRGAYRIAAPLAERGGASDRALAAYLAGLSAMELNQLDLAEHYLRRATTAPDEGLAADALAALGLVHHRQGRYAEAADALTRAADRLTGDARANALFYAGIAEQKLDRWAQARTKLVLARSATRNPALRQRIDDQLAVTGYTVQVGAFTDPANARRAAEQWAARAANLRLGLPQLVPSTDRTGRAITLVQVGRFGSYAAAQSARSRLGVRGSIVVPIASR